MLPCVRSAWRATLPHTCSRTFAPRPWPHHQPSPSHPQPQPHPGPIPPRPQAPTGLLRLHASSASSSPTSTAPEPATTAATAPDPSVSLPREPDVTDDGLVDDWQQRTRLLVGESGIAALASTRVLLVGLGGVGSFAGEFLARAGIGQLTIVDGDVVDTTNRNRQLPALCSTIGQSKAALMEARLLDINPALRLTVRHEFLHPDTAEQLVASAPYDYVLDCIDSIAPKVHLIAAAHARGMRVVSSMGAGGRRDPSAIQVADISKTYNDRFAAEVRRSLRKRHGIRSGVAAVFSSELAAKSTMTRVEGSRYKKSYYGTISYIPALFGLNMAAHVINTVLDDVERAAAKAAKGGQAPQSAQRGHGQSRKGAMGSSAQKAGGAGTAAGGEAKQLQFDDVSGVGMGYDGTCI